MINTYAVLFLLFNFAAFSNLGLAYDPQAGGPNIRQAIIVGTILKDDDKSGGGPTWHSKYPKCPTPMTAKPAQAAADAWYSIIVKSELKKGEKLLDLKVNGPNEASSVTSHSEKNLSQLYVTGQTEKETAYGVKYKYEATIKTADGNTKTSFGTIKMNFDYVKCSDKDSAPLFFEVPNRVLIGAYPLADVKSSGTGEQVYSPREGAYTVSSGRGEKSYSSPKNEHEIYVDRQIEIQNNTPEARALREQEAKEEATRSSAH